MRRRKATPRREKVEDWENLDRNGEPCESLGDLVLVWGSIVALVALVIFELFVLIMIIHVD